MKEDEDHPPFTETEPANLELEQLVAARIALNPERRAWRNDIVTSTALALLTSGDRATPELLEVVNRTLRTRTLTVPELDTSLETARTANLVRQVTDLTGAVLWQATETARAEISEDRAWAQQAYAEFERQVAAALRARDLDVEARKVPKYAANLLRALSAGSCESMRVEQVTERALRPLEFNRQAVQAQLAAVDPRSAREALAELADAAMDVDDSFGNEIIHLLVVSNLLHAMFTRSDVSVDVDFRGMRVLLDTSALIDFIVEGSPEQQLLMEGVRLWAEAGIDVVVGDHTVDEWARLWDAALLQNPTAYDDVHVEPLTHRLVGPNPFVIEFVRRKETTDSGVTWRQFEGKVRDLRMLLAKLPVKVRPAGNHQQADIDVVERAHGIIRELAEDPNVRGRRTRGAAVADAESCAMLVRWRQNASGPHVPYFVAKERLTELAYRRIVPDDEVPLTINVAGLTAYVAALTTRDPGQRAHIAEVVSTALVRDTVFGVATQYTLDEAFQLARMLAEADGVRPEDARQAMQLNLDTLLAETAAATAPERILAVGSELIRRRSARRDDRARREQSRAEERERATEERERAAEAKAAAAAVRNATTAALLEERETQIRELRSELAARSQPAPAPPPTPSGWSAARWRKAMIALGISLLAWAAVAVAIAAGWLDTTREQAVAVAASFLISATCAEVVHSDRSWLAAAIALVVGVAFLALEVAVGLPV